MADRRVVNQRTALDSEAGRFLKALFLVVVVGIVIIIVVNILTEMNKNAKCIYIGGVCY